MARLLIGAAIGVAIGVVVGAALDISAREPTEEVVALALEASVDPYELEAAAATVGVSPRTYAYGTGLLAPPGLPVASVWTRLAACESTGRWNANTGNGFFGGLQFDRGTWLAYGGGMYAPFAHQASPAQQIAIAERLRAERGYQPWPACRRILRLP